MRPADDGGGSMPFTEVDVDSLAEAARLLGEYSTELATALDTVRTRAVDGLAAIPDSDLYNAYAFCWGRWSQQLEDGSTALGLAGGIARNASGAYRTTDRRFGGC